MSKRFRNIGVEPLEGRTLLSAVGSHDLISHHGQPSFTTVYTESNNPAHGQNAVLAYRGNSDNGALRQIGSFATGGTGQGNDAEKLGPDDSDQEVVASADRRFLLAVNQGSNSITVFRIHRDGELSRAGTFDSGGVQPASIGIAGNNVYVVNRGDAIGSQAGTVAPNYAAFTLGKNGKLTAIAGSTVTLPIGLSPAQALVSRDGKFLFGDNFAIPGTTPALGDTIDPFQINLDGTLTGAPGGPVGPTGITPPVLLGLATHPTQPIVYAGLTGAAQVGVFTYDPAGKLTFAGAIADQGKGPCWITVSRDGRFMYVANTGTDSVGVYSLANPLAPTQVQEFALSGPLAAPGAPAGALQTGAFQLALDPSGQSLYVVTQSQNQAFPQGNALHALAIGADGTLTELRGPVFFSADDVPANARPQGLAVVASQSGNGGDSGDHHNEGDNRRRSSSRTSHRSHVKKSPFSDSSILTSRG